jgi:hypothetical protein
MDLASVRIDNTGTRDEFHEKVREYLNRMRTTA